MGNFYYENREYIERLEVIVIFMDILEGFNRFEKVKWWLNIYSIKIVDEKE